MKKLVLVSVLTAGLYFVSNAQVTFGVHGNGIVASGTEKFEEDGQTEEINGKARVSWKIGTVVNIPVSLRFSFMPQLNVVNKGYKLKDAWTLNEDGFNLTTEVEGTTRLTYLEMPLNFVYNKNSFFIGAGPSISLGLSGKSEGYVVVREGGTIIEEEESSSDVVFDGDDEANDEKYHLKAIEFGANIIAGYKFNNGLFVNAHYNLGLSNNDPYEGTTSKSRYFGVGIGYFFSK